MNLPSAAQIKGSISDFVLIAGTILGVAGIFGVSPDTIQHVSQTLSLIGSNAGDISAAAGTLLGVASLVYKGWKRTASGQVASIKALPPDAANAAVAALPAAAKTDIKLAAIPDSALIKAVSAMSDVANIVVKDNAGNGIGKALADSAQPKVIAVSDVVLTK